MNSRSMRRLVGYRRLWLATAQIGLSSWMVQVALFAALVSHHSARVMAMVLLVATMPSLLAGPLFGAWLDGDWSAMAALRSADHGSQPTPGANPIGCPRTVHPRTRLIPSPRHRVHTEHSAPPWRSP